MTITRPLRQNRNKKSIIFSQVARLLETAMNKPATWTTVVAECLLFAARPIFYIVFGKNIWRFSSTVFDSTSEAAPFLKMQVGERGLWDLYFCSMDELYSLRTVFQEFPGPPGTIADLGCGLGRSTVFIKQMMGWQQSRSILIDGTSESGVAIVGKLGKYQTGFHHELHVKESVYNSLALTEAFLRSNSMENFVTKPLESFPLRDPNELGSIDLLFSFQAVGYHWDIQTALRDLKLLQLINKNGMLIFGIRNREKSERQGIPYIVPTIPGLQLTHVIEGFHRQDFLVYRRQ